MQGNGICEHMNYEKFPCGAGPWGGRAPSGHCVDVAISLLVGDARPKETQFYKCNQKCITKNDRVWNRNKRDNAESTKGYCVENKEVLYALS